MVVGRSTCQRCCYAVYEASRQQGFVDRPAGGRRRGLSSETGPARFKLPRAAPPRPPHSSKRRGVADSIWRRPSQSTSWSRAALRLCGLRRHQLGDEYPRTGRAGVEAETSTMGEFRPVDLLSLISTAVRRGVDAQHVDRRAQGYSPDHPSFQDGDARPTAPGGFHPVLSPGSPRSWVVSARISCSDDQLLALGVGHLPQPVVLAQRVGGVHPVEGLVGTAVGVDGHASVGLHHHEANRFRQVGGESALVVDGAASDDEPHRREVTRRRAPRGLPGSRRPATPPPPRGRPPPATPAGTSR